MIVALIILAVLLAVLVMVSSIVPPRSQLSGYELRRREKTGDEQAADEVWREELLPDVESLLRALTALLLVVFVLSAVGLMGWVPGIVLAVVAALEYGALGRLGWLHGPAQSLYEKYEPELLRLVARFPAVFRVIRAVSPMNPPEPRLESREQLEDLVDHAGSLLSADEKRLILHGLQYESRLVSEIMTPRGVIDSISKKELLGPLVLDDLHKTGHSRFPVIDGDIDHVVGVLHIRDLLVLDAKQRSVSAEKAMEPQVFYIREDQTLAHALAAFLRTHHHLFIVVNEFRETVGLLTLEDVVEALLGRKIIDEFDAHDDLRAVAARNLRGNNKPKKGQDV